MAVRRPSGVGRLFAGVVVGVVAVVVIAAIAVAMLGGRTASYPSGTPQAAVQAYLGAYAAGDYETSYGLLSGSVRTRLTLRDFIDRTSWDPGLKDARISITSTDVEGSRATVRLAIDRYWASGLQSSHYREDRDLRLVLEDGRWLIDQSLIGTQVYP